MMSIPVIGTTIPCADRVIIKQAPVIVWCVRLYRKINLKGTITQINHSKIADLESLFMLHFQTYDKNEDCKRMGLAQALFMLVILMG